MKASYLAALENLEVITMHWVTLASSAFYYQQASCTFTLKQQLDFKDTTRTNFRHAQRKVQVFIWSPKAKGLFLMWRAAATTKSIWHEKKVWSFITISNVWCRTQRSLLNKRFVPTFTGRRTVFSNKAPPWKSVPPTTNLLHPRSSRLNTCRTCYG